jgi:hypothetical protein
MAEEEKKERVAKAKKVADPIAASIDPATQEMIVRAQDRCPGRVSKVKIPVRVYAVRRRTR